MKILYTILLFIGLPFLALAQKASLSGKVVDAINNEALPFVNVVVSGTQIGTVTDVDGHFVLDNLNPGFIRIEASFVGYKKQFQQKLKLV